MEGRRQVSNKNIASDLQGTSLLEVDDAARDLTQGH